MFKSIKCYQSSKSVLCWKDWSQIPVEAFQPRHDLTGHTTPPDRLDGTDHEALLVAAAESGASQIPAPADDMEQSEEYLNLMMGCYTPVAAPTLDFTNIVVQTIKFFAEHVSKVIRAISFSVIEDFSLCL